MILETVDDTVDELKTLETVDVLKTLDASDSRVRFQLQPSTLIGARQNIGLVIYAPIPIHNIITRLTRVPA